MIVYGIKNKEGNFFNRIHKDCRELSQNTAFYKTKLNASNELSHAQNCCLQEEFVNKNKERLRHIDYYKELREYVKSNWDEELLTVVKLEIREI